MAGPYVLPDLPYDYGALEPHLSGEIMELHHGRHHLVLGVGSQRDGNLIPSPGVGGRR
jgi:hypothetical protein